MVNLGICSFGDPVIRISIASSGSRESWRARIRRGATAFQWQVRAVAHACATNPVSLDIPCHRVVRTGGGMGGYRWGIARKKALLAAEHRMKD
jgi:O-6-methylguanine DNA methyltransferase